MCIDVLSQFYFCSFCYFSAPLCSTVTCGVNTFCIVVNNVPVCECDEGYMGNPLAGCQGEMLLGKLLTYHIVHV